MNLPTEYVLRNNRAARLLSLPCSLLLETKAGATVVIIGSVAGPDEVSVQRHNLQNTSPLRATEEGFIKAADIFKSPSIAIPGAKTLPFCETPYLFRGKQVPTLPQSALQIKDYDTTIRDYFFPLATKNIREDWLWKQFGVSNIPMSLRASFYSKERLVQQEITKVNSEKVWFLWCRWRDLFLPPGVVAPELVFLKTFGGKVMSQNTETDNPFTDDQMPEMDFFNPGIGYSHARPSAALRIEEMRQAAAVRVKAMSAKNKKRLKRR